MRLSPLIYATLAAGSAPSREGIPDVPLVLSYAGGLTGFDGKAVSVHVSHMRGGSDPVAVHQWSAQLGRHGSRVWNAPITLHGLMPGDTLQFWLEGIPFEVEMPPVQASMFLQGKVGEPKDLVMMSARGPISSMGNLPDRRHLRISNISPHITKHRVVAWIKEKLGVSEYISASEDDTFQPEDLKRSGKSFSLLSKTFYVHLPARLFQAALQLDGEISILSSQGYGASRAVFVRPIGVIQPKMARFDAPLRPASPVILPRAVQLTFFRLNTETPMVKYVTLIRHGESMWNEGTEGGLRHGILNLGYLTLAGKDHPLSREGWDQCFQGSEESAVQDAVGKASLLLLSPFQRATETGMVFFRKAMEKGRRAVMLGSAREKRGTVVSRDCMGDHVGTDVFKSACRRWTEAVDNDKTVGPEGQRRAIRVGQLCRRFTEAGRRDDMQRRTAALEAGKHLFFHGETPRDARIFVNDAAQEWWSTWGDSRTALADRLEVLTETLLLSEHTTIALAAHSLLFRELFRTYYPDPEALWGLCKMANAKAVSIMLSRSPDGRAMIADVSPVSGGNVLKPLTKADVEEEVEEEQEEENAQVDKVPEEKGVVNGLWNMLSSKRKATTPTGTPLRCCLSKEQDFC